MLPSDWLDCLAFWRRREKYPQKDIVWEYLSFFEKDTSQATLYLLCCSEELGQQPGSEHTYADTNDVAEA